MDISPQYWQFIWSNSITLIALATCIFLALSPYSRYRICYTPPPHWMAIGVALFAIYMISYSPYIVNDIIIKSDKSRYALRFAEIIRYGVVLEDITKDPLWSFYMYGTTFLSKNVNIFFLITGFIYVFNFYIFIKKYVPKYTFILLLSVFVSLSFYNYGVNTMRAGLAASFLIAALSNYKNKYKFAFFLILAIGFHKSMAIPALAIVVSLLYDNVKLYLLIWFSSIFASALAGHYFEVQLFDVIGDSDERVKGYVNFESDTIYNSGFRIDFIIYSCLPVFAIYYYRIIKKYDNRLYSIMANTYIIANTFWILVIRANFSDRFAYLSWFLYPIILLYPALKKRFWINQQIIVAGTVFGLAMFTFILIMLDMKKQ